MKAGSAQNRTPLRGTKWNCGLHSARRTLGPGFRPDPRTPVRAFGLALLAALGIVLEILVVKEELLARGKDEFGAAINALQYLIGEFHGRLPPTQETTQIGHDLRMCRSVSLRRALFSRARAAKDLAAKLVFFKTNKKTETRRSRAGAQL